MLGGFGIGVVNYDEGGVTCVYCWVWFGCVGGSGYRVQGGDKVALGWVQRRVVGREVLVFNQCLGRGGGGGGVHLPPRIEHEL